MNTVFAILMTKICFMNLGWRYEFIDMTLNRSRESNKLYLLESSLL